MLYDLVDLFVILREQNLKSSHQFAPTTNQADT